MWFCGTSWFTPRLPCAALAVAKGLKTAPNLARAPCTGQMPAGGWRDKKTQAWPPSGILPQCKFRVKPTDTLPIAAAGRPDPEGVHGATDAAWKDLTWHQLAHLLQPLHGLHLQQTAPRSSSQLLNTPQKSLRVPEFRGFVRHETSSPDKRFLVLFSFTPRLLHAARV